MTLGCDSYNLKISSEELSYLQACSRLFLECVDGFKVRHGTSSRSSTDSFLIEAYPDLDLRELYDMSDEYCRILEGVRQ